MVVYIFKRQYLKLRTMSIKRQLTSLKDNIKAKRASCHNWIEFIQSSFSQVQVFSLTLLENILLYLKMRWICLLFVVLTCGWKISDRKSKTEGRMFVRGRPCYLVELSSCPYADAKHAHLFTETGVRKGGKTQRHCFTWSKYEELWFGR